MFVVFFMMWVIFNGQWTTEIALLGLFLCAALYLFAWKFMGYGPAQDLHALQRLPRALAYLWTLLVEIFKANIHVMRLILSPQYEVEPELIEFRTKLQTDPARAVLADSITLTPGTITVLVEGDRFVVHALDKTLGDGVDDSDFERRLLKMEGKR